MRSEEVKLFLLNAPAELEEKQTKALDAILFFFSIYLFSLLTKYINKIKLYLVKWDIRPLNMKIVLVYPIEYLKNLPKTPTSSMCVATQDILKDTKYLKEAQEEKKKGRYLIMDSVVSSGVEISEGNKVSNTKDIIKAYNLLKPNTVVIPNRTNNKNITIELTLDFIKETKDTLKCDLIAIPQGVDLEDWITCYKYLAQLKEIHSIGIRSIDMDGENTSKVVQITNKIRYLINHNYINTQKTHYILLEKECTKTELQLIDKLTR